MTGWRQVWKSVWMWPRVRQAPSQDGKGGPHTHPYSILRRSLRRQCSWTEK